MSSENDWVTIASFNWLHEALVQRSFLEDQGIEVLIPEERASSVMPVGNAITVRVQVREKDRKQALELLAEIESGARAIEETEE